MQTIMEIINLTRRILWTSAKKIELKELLDSGLIVEAVAIKMNLTVDSIKSAMRYYNIRSKNGKGRPGRPKLGNIYHR